MRIIAIDPGYERLGIAILEKFEKTKELVLFSECFQTDKKLSHPERLALVGNEIRKIIKEYTPEILAIETLFFSKNVKTALSVAEARGVALFCASDMGLEIREFSPADIKIAVTGHGQSDKKQVITMVEKLVKINGKIKHDDEYDAIATGITYFAMNRVRYPQK